MFLIAPSILSLLNDEADISIFYSVEEEEESHQEVKHENLFKSELFSNTNSNYSFNFQIKFSSLNLDKEYYYDPFLAVLVPPPKKHI